MACEAGGVGSCKPGDGLPPLFDCHCHLTAGEFDEDRDEVIAQAAMAGVGGILAVAMSMADAQQVLDLAADYPGVVFPCLGLHPVNPATGGSVDETELDAMLALIRTHAAQLACIGEVGLDFTPAVLGKSPEGGEAAKAAQRRVLRAHADLAAELGLPLNVHSRGAGHHAIELLQDAGVEARVLLHAFDGKAKYAVAAAEAGMKFSIPPSVVRSPVMQKMLKRLPLSAVVLESDAPALAAEKGGRNEPAAIVTSLTAIAEAHGLTLQATAEAVHATSVALIPALAGIRTSGS